MSAGSRETEPCLDLYVFLLSIPRTRVSDLRHGKWQSNTLSNGRERAGEAAIIPKMSRSNSEPGNKQPEYKTPCSAPAEGTGGNATPSAPQLNFLESVTDSMLMTPYGNKGRQCLGVQRDGGRSLCLSVCIKGVRFFILVKFLDI